MKCFIISFLSTTTAAQAGHLPPESPNLFSSSAKEDDGVEFSLSPDRDLNFSKIIEISGTATSSDVPAFFESFSHSGDFDSLLTWSASFLSLQVADKVFCNVREIVENQLVFTGAKMAPALYTSVNIIVTKK